MAVAVPVKVNVPLAADVAVIDGYSTSLTRAPDMFCEVVLSITVPVMLTDCAKAAELAVIAIKAAAAGRIDRRDIGAPLFLGCRCSYLTLRAVRTLYNVA
jgi:hypothetical protein